MKKYLLLLALLPLAALSVHAQKLAEKQVPAAVVATFRQAHPAAKGVKWEKEDANYEAGYERGEKKLSVVITPTGTLLETETELAVSQLPAPVRTALTTQYKGYKVTEAAKIVTATGTTIYEAEISRAGKKRDLLFNADGTEVKK
ncbi:hypothetical protein GCM10027346_40200 [Hymenobacter seoulensis]